MKPTVHDNGKSNKKNVTNIQFLWYPRTNLHYKKGSSKAEDPSKMKYGDFVIYISPEKYSGTGEYFSQMFNSVDDLLTNILNGCTNMLCTEGKVKPQYYRKDYFEITNKQSQKDYTPF